MLTLASIGKSIRIFARPTGDSLQQSIGARRRARLSRACIEALEPRQLLSATYYVATTGSDSNPGTLSQPFQTIQQGANVAQSGDTVDIEGGTYRETVTPPHSGVTFTNYNNQSVTVSAAKLVTGTWSLTGGSIYQISGVPNMGQGSNQVFVDGTLMNDARWPNTSLDLSHPNLETAGQVTDSGGTYTLQDPSLTQTAGFWDGATIHIAPGQNGGWVNYTGTVSNSGVINGVPSIQFTLPGDNDSSELPSAGNRYFLTGASQALDTAGEFYIDSSNKLTLWDPNSDSPANHTVEVKARYYTFDLRNVANTTMQGLNLFAGGIQTSSTSSGTTINNVTVTYGGVYGNIKSGWDYAYTSTADGIAAISLLGINSTVENSTINFSAGSGVFVSASSVTANNNTINNTDYSGTDQAPVFLASSGDKISNNKINYVGRDGINDRLGNNTVTGNTISNFMLQTSDGGGIYTRGLSGSQYGYNTISGGHASYGYDAVGVYLDDNSSGFNVHDNVTSDVDAGFKANSTSLSETINHNNFGGSKFAMETNGTYSWAGTTITNNVFGNPLTSITDNFFGEPTVNYGTGVTPSGNLYVPTGLTVTGTTSSSVSLSWSADPRSAGASVAGYAVYRQNPGGLFQQIATTPTTVTTFQDNTASSSTTYLYSVAAVHGTDNWQTGLSIYVPATTPAGSSVVTSAADDGSAGTLRYVVSHAGAGATITFSPSVFSASSPQTITLNGSQLELSQNITIQGPGLGILTISGNNATRVFQIDSGVIGNLSGMTITKGNAGTSGSNPGQSGGGGIYVYGGTLNLSNAAVIDSLARLGGAIYAYPGTVNLSNCTISNNTATNYGGGLDCDTGTTATAVGCTFNNNTAEIDGGGVLDYGNTLSLTNDTIAYNSATGGEGGGISNLQGALTVSDCTILGNTSTSTGAGIYAGSPATINNTIVAKDTTNGSPSDIAGSGLSTSSEYNLVGDGSGGLSASNHNLLGSMSNLLDPKLGSLTLNGGTTATMAPQTSSPVIDAGSNSLASGLSSDQQGLTRIINGVVDIGAVELQQAVVTSTADTNTLGTLRYAITNVSSGGTIVFSPTVFSAGASKTITLAGTELEIANSLTIQGPGQGILTISGNNASRVFQIDSGATASLSGMTITGGNAGTSGSQSGQSGGGGIYVSGGTLTMSNATVTGNTARLGGGIYAYPGTATLQTCTISNNTATNYGGGLDVDSGATGTAIGCTFNNNNASLQGGGVLDYGNTLTLTNDTIFHNSSASGPGGGIDNLQGMLTVTDCTIDGNTSAQAGGGIYVGTPVTLNNTIVAKNTAGSSPSDIAGSSATGSYNLVGDGSGGLSTSNHNLLGSTSNLLDPQLGSLSLNGGSTATMLPLAGSPLIDAGSNSLIPSGVTTDEQTLTRIVNGVVDIGAAESGNGVITSAADTNTPGTLRYAIANTGPGGTITFGPGVFSAASPQIITLSGAELDITHNLTIQGPGQGILTISGNNAVRVFQVESGVTATLSGMIITNGNAGTSGSNPGQSGGGGIYVSGGTLTLSNATVTGNTARLGGGIYAYPGTVNLTNCTISNNTATNYGGGLDIDSGATATAVGCTFNNNTANIDGGGVLDYGNTVSLTNDTIAYNAATGGEGGGISNLQGTLTVTNCTIMGNTSTSAGAGIYAGSPVTINNTIVAKDTTSGSPSDIAGSGLSTSSAYNLIGDGSGGLSASNHNLLGSMSNLLDPKLGSLTLNGGTTATMAPQTSSPVIDAGSNNLASGLSSDQQGLTRIINGVVDIGAVELQ